ncbi:dynamin family protein [Bdellovibrionota bacterium FG-1]
MDLKSGLDLGEYSALRQAIERRLRRIADIADVVAMSSVSKLLRDDIAAMNEDRFSIAVVGEFSHGKSTLINALLGADVLPSSYAPTTAIINRIKFGTEENYKLVYRDPDVDHKCITLSEFRKLIAPDQAADESLAEKRRYAEACANLQAIKFSQITFPTPALPAGVEIIDTPGTNDTDDLRVEITYGLLPTVDAVIFLFKVDQAATGSEFTFLRDRIMKEDIKCFFFVINKIDQENLANVKKVQKHVQEQLHKEAQIETTQVFPVSALYTLEIRTGRAAPPSEESILPLVKSGFTEFERNLSAFLVSERGRAKLEKPVARGHTAVKELLERTFPLLKTGASASEQKLSSAIALLEKEKIRTQELIDVLMAELDSSLTTKGFELSRALNTRLREISKALEAGLDEYAGSLEEAEIKQHLEAIVAPLQTKLQQDLRSEQQTSLRKAFDRASQRLNKIWTDTLGKTFDAIGASQDINLSVPEFDAEKGGAEIGVALQFGVAFLAGWFLSLPVAIGALLGLQKHFQGFLDTLARPSVLEKIKAQVHLKYSELIPEHVKSFEVGWEQKLSSLKTAIQKEVDGRFSELQQQLLNLLKERQSAQQSAEENLRKLTQMENELKAIDSELTNLFTTGTRLK